MTGSFSHEFKLVKLWHPATLCYLLTSQLPALLLRLYIALLMKHLILVSSLSLNGVIPPIEQRDSMRRRPAARAALMPRNSSGPFRLLFENHLIKMSILPKDGCSLARAQVCAAENNAPGFQRIKGDLESCSSFVVSFDSLDVLRWFPDALVLKYQCEPIGAYANFPISTPSIPSKSAP